MRKGRDGLSGIVREEMKHNPKHYDEAFIFYSKDYKKVKMLYYDSNGYVMYQKWFDNGRFLKPEFQKILSCDKLKAAVKAAQEEKKAIVFGYRDSGLLSLLSVFKCIQ